MVACGAEILVSMADAGQRTFASVAVSLDGFIASADGSMDWLHDVMRRDEDYGLAESMARGGAVIVGATTFRESLSMMGARGLSSPTFVLTHAAPEGAPAGVTFYAGDLGALVAEAKASTDRDVHVFGGGEVIAQLLEADLLDELTLAVVPVILGEGTRLFATPVTSRRLTLTSCRSFPSGIVLLRYDRAD
jgi:dihydrofolate reductase